MKNKNLILEKIETLVNTNRLNNYTCLVQKFSEFLDCCPDDKLLADALPKWNKRSATLELYWDIAQDSYATYVLGEHKISWNVVFWNKRYNHQKEGVDNFFACLQKCIDYYNEWYDYFTCKLLSKSEFFHEFKAELHHYTDLIISNNNGEYDGAVLGINRNNLRPHIDKEKELSDCDIFELGDCINFDSLKANLGRYEYDTENVLDELMNHKFIHKIGDRYFPHDDVAGIKEITKKNQRSKISKNEFYERFNHCIYYYLEELNQKKVYTRITKTYNAPKYLGIDVETLKPYVSIIEGLVGCDVYDLTKITECYEKDNEGKFLFQESKIGIYSKLIIKNKTLINELVDSYFDESSKSSIKLPLIKKAEDYNILQSEYIQIYKNDWQDVVCNSSVAGKFSDCLWTDRYIEIPKTLLDIFKQYVKEKVKRDKDFKNSEEYVRKANEYKKEKNYDEAIKWYLKCKELLPNVNVGTSRGMFHDLLICYRMVKDFHSRAIIAKEAHEAFPEEIKFEKAYMETFFQLKKISLPEKSHEIENTVNYGELYEKEIRKLPEYTFFMKDSPFHRYSKGSKRYEWFIPDRRYFKIIEGTRKIQEHFWMLIRKAQDAEAIGKIDEAVASYELLLAEGCYRTTPIDRLIVLYSKQHRKEELKRVLIKSIQHFRELEERQFEYVTFLAEKYNAVEELKKQLKEKEVVRYWGGDIILYQKYKKVDSWEKRLAKLS